MIIGFVIKLLVGQLLIAESSKLPEKIIDLVFVIDRVCPDTPRRVDPAHVKSMALLLPKLFLENKKDEFDSLLSAYTIGNDNDAKELIPPTSDFNTFKRGIDLFTLRFEDPASYVQIRAAKAVENVRSHLNRMSKDKNRDVPDMIIWLTGISWTSIYKPFDSLKFFVDAGAVSLVAAGQDGTRPNKFYWIYSTGFKEYPDFSYEDIHAHISKDLLDRCGYRDDPCVFVDHQQQTCRSNRTFNSKGRDLPFCYAGFMEHYCKDGRQGCVDACNKAEKFDGPCSCKDGKRTRKPSDERFRHCGSVLVPCSSDDVEKACAAGAPTADVDMAPTAVTVAPTDGHKPIHEGEKAGTSENQSLKGWHIALIIVGLLAVIAVSVVITVIVLRRKRRKRRASAAGGRHPSAPVRQSGSAEKEKRGSRQRSGEKSHRGTQSPKDSRESNDRQTPRRSSSPPPRPPRGRSPRRS